MRMRMRGTIIAAALLLGATSAVAVGAQASGPPASAPGTASEGFGYSGDTGPGFWADLSPANALCGSGTRQSPINIGRVKIDPALRRLKLTLKPTPISLINNGHTIKEEIRSRNTLTLNGDVYTADQFHLHTLSEHTIHGQRGVMELHAVFVDPAGKIAVVGLLFRIGRKNAFLAKLSSAGLPTHSGDHVTSQRKITLADGLTDTSAYYTYSGSLTTPPCTEGLTWFVLKDEAHMSRAQFREFENIMGNNFRPLQPLNGRVVRATANGGTG